VIRRSFSPVQIAGNIAGATIGGFAGSRLGAIRDAKGKSVYTVFTQLGSDQKAQILKALAVKVSRFSHACSLLSL